MPLFEVLVSHLVVSFFLSFFLTFSFWLLEHVIENLMQLGGFSREQALEALQVCNGDGEAAASYLLRFVSRCTRWS